jgi:hypothetical protein
VRTSQVDATGYARMRDRREVYVVLRVYNIFGNDNGLEVFVFVDSWTLLERDI